MMTSLASASLMGVQRVGGETPEHDRVRRPEPRAGEHRDDGLDEHRQVDRDAVAGLHAQGLHAFAARWTCSCSSAYVTARVSPGSPSKCSATRSPFPASTWRSTQFTATLSLPPTNHFANGAPDQSRTSVKSVSHVTFSRACSAQNPSRSAAARS